MPYDATVYNVLIASPGDVQVERNLVRDVIHEWNAIHSRSRHIVFQPIAWETHSHPSMGDRAQGVLNRQILNDADLLVAIFWTRLGTPTGDAPGGSVEELDRHMQAGKPAMVYFSSVPVRPESVSNEQYRALVEFRDNWCRPRGLVESFDSPNDFRQKFARQLATKINDDDYFSVEEDETVRPTPYVPIPIVAPRDIPELTKEATTLLLAAAEDPSGYIMHRRVIGGIHLQTGGKEFIENNNPRSRAAWEGALQELEEFRLVQAIGHERNIYQVTREGYDMAELLRS